MTAITNLPRAISAAGLAELVWTGSGTPQALGVVPLLLDATPAVALPWAYLDQARAAAASPRAALVLSDPRLSGSPWQPLAATGRLTLVEDRDGSLFVDRLLDEELRKHPPARALAGSPLLRREHWWYLPRLVLLLEPDAVVATRARTGPRDAVLAVADDADLQVCTVGITRWDTDPLLVDGGPRSSGPALLVGQEVSVPDAERWTVHVTSGTYADGRLTEVRPAAVRELEPVPGLRTRVRRQRALQKSCVQALRAAGPG